MGKVSNCDKMASLKVLVLVALVTVAAGQSNFICPEKDGCFEDTNQCDKYYDCLDGIAEERLCPDGLVFDPFSRKREPCDHYFNVDCGDRLEPQQPVSPPQWLLLPPRPCRLSHLLRLCGWSGRGVHLLLACGLMSTAASVTGQRS